LTDVSSPALRHPLSFTRIISNTHEYLSLLPLPIVSQASSKAPSHLQKRMPRQSRLHSLEDLMSDRTLRSTLLPPSQEILTVIRKMKKGLQSLRQPHHQYVFRTVRNRKRTYLLPRRPPRDLSKLLATTRILQSPLPASSSFVYRCVSRFLYGLQHRHNWYIQAE
jgi:hypothetical protein